MNSVKHKYVSKLKALVHISMVTRSCNANSTVSDIEFKGECPVAQLKIKINQALSELVVFKSYKEEAKQERKICRFFFVMATQNSGRKYELRL